MVCSNSLGLGVLLIQVHCTDKILTYHYFAKTLKDVKQVMVSSSLLKVSNK